MFRLYSFILRHVGILLIMAYVDIVSASRNFCEMVFITCFLKTVRSFVMIIAAQDNDIDIMWLKWRFCVEILAALAKLRKAAISFVMSVRPQGTSRLPLGGFSWNSMSEYFPKIWGENQVSLTSGKNIEYFTWIPVYIYGNVSLISTSNEKCFSQTLHRRQAMCI